MEKIVLETKGNQWHYFVEKWAIEGYKKH